MQAIRPTEIHNWVQKGGHLFPKVLGFRCGHCNERPRWVIDDPATKVAYGGAPAAMQCGNCGKVVNLFAVERPTSKTQPGCLFVHPHAKTREQLDLSELEWPAALRRAYEECVEALDARLFTAALSQARRTLEGVVKQLLGPDYPGARAMLGNLLKDLPASTDLAKPVMDAAVVLKDGGNMASHFDLERIPDEETAVALVELLEDLIEYLFLLPHNVAEIRRKLAGDEPDS